LGFVAFIPDYDHPRSIELLDRADYLSLRRGYEPGFNQAIPA